jgi:glycosyltransferase involved in cell wall biosynthesis
MIRIGLDMSRLGHQRGGEETYSVNLARALARIDAENDYYLYYATPPSRPLVDQVNVHERCVGPESLWIRTPLTLPRAAWKDRVDVLHVVHVTPPVCTARMVVTAFDVSYEVYPEHFPLGLRLRLSKLVPYSVRRARKVLTISEYSKRQLIEWYRLPEDKVEVVSCGVDTALYRPIPREDAWARLRVRYAGIGERFILYVGSLQPRKNVPRLLEAYARLVAEEGIEHQLLLVGKHKWLTAEVAEALERLKLTDKRVRFTGHVPDEDLPFLFNAADLMVFPSLFEGFGLPCVEAMACGTPVVCARATSLPEVVGDAAILVDPLDVGDIARGMLEVLSDEACRLALRARGLVRAQAFSWDETARRALRVFRGVASAG